MPKHHLSIDEETMAVLRRSEVSASSVTLPPGQLPRPLYEKVNKVLLLAGGKWNKSAKAHLFSDDPSEKLGLAVESGSIKDVKKATQAFYTPPELAADVVELARVSGCSVLEPSAGRGALAKECVIRGASNVSCVESDETSFAALVALDFNVKWTDFLQLKPVAVFDRVVMNPPFSDGQDVDHVTHAFGFLGAGGRLVAIMSPGWQTKQDRRSKAFRTLVEEHGCVDREVAGGAFKSSGTGVSTVIVVLEK